MLNALDDNACLIPRGVTKPVAIKDLLDYASGSMT
jgi:hypothetical protein